MYDFTTPVVRVVNVSFFIVFMGTGGAGASCKFYNSSCKNCKATLSHSFHGCEHTSTSCTSSKLPVVRIVSVSFFTVFMGTSGAGASCKFYNSNCNSCEATFLHSFDACRRTSASCTILKLQNAPLNAGVSRSLGHHVRQHNHFRRKFQIQISYLTA